MRRTTGSVGMAAALVMSLVAGTAFGRGTAYAQSTAPFPRSVGQTPALAGDNVTASLMKTACQRDYRAHCIGNDPAPPIAAGCLSQFYINLSGECRVALDAYSGRSAASAPSGE